MRERILLVSRLWPGITPMTVWDMTLEDWILFAAAADAWLDEQQTADRAGRRQR